MDRILPTPLHEEEARTTTKDGRQSTTRQSVLSENTSSETLATTQANGNGSTTTQETHITPSPKARREYTQTKTLFHSYQIIWYIFGFIEIVLAFRFILKLVGANPLAGFTKFVYSLSAPFVAPFLTMFRATSNRGAETTSYLEWSTIVAAIVYIVLTWGIIKIFKLGKPTNEEEVRSVVTSQ